MWEVNLCIEESYVLKSHSQEPIPQTPEQQPTTFFAPGTGLIYGTASREGGRWLGDGDRRQSSGDNASKAPLAHWLLTACCAAHS